MYAVDPHEVAKLPQMTFDEILDRIEDLPRAPWVTLSGGNPALFQLHDLVTRLHYRAMHVAIETQGTIWHDWIALCDLVTCSPKPPSSGNPTAPAIAEKFHGKWKDHHPHSHGRFVYKVVVFDDEDWAYARSLFIDRQDLECWVQVGNPIVTGPIHPTMLLDQLHWLCSKVLEDEEMSHVRVTPQLHVLIWGNSRGV